MDTEGPGKPEHEAEGYALIGSCFEVYKALGNGYLEDVDQKSLEIELGDQGIPFVALLREPVFDQGRALPKHDEADRLVFARISVALKAVQALLPEPEAPLEARSEGHRPSRGLPCKLRRLSQTRLEASGSLIRRIRDFQ